MNFEGMSRETALSVASVLVGSGAIISPKQKRDLQQILGELSSDENELLASFGRVRAARERQNADDMQRIADTLKDWPR